MDARSVTTVRVPTARLLPAVTAAMEAYRAARWAEIDEAVEKEMSGPIPQGWWARTFDRHPAKTREEATERLKTKPEFGWSRWDAIWHTDDDAWAKLTALRDACELRLDHVEVAADDVRVFKEFYQAGGEAYR